MGECLSRILFPLDIGSFLKHYHARTHCHIGRNSPDYYEYLLNASDIDAYLQSEQLPAAFVNVVKQGTRVPRKDWSRIVTSVRGASRVAIPERLFDLYSEGATLILNAADRALPSLGAVCRTLTLDLGFPANANVYITPRNAAGFAEHTDDHEVLIVQLAGRKRWLLYTHEASPVPVNLESGDLLYVPRGLAHAARTQECDSIHIALGLKPVYAFQLIEELALLASKDDVFQPPVPPRFVNDDAKRIFETTFLRQLQNLILRTTTSELLDRRFHSLVEKQPRGWPGRFSDLRLFRDMTPETIVCRRPEILTIVENDGRFLCVVFADKRILVPSFLEGALRQIMSGNSFAIGEIEGFITGPGKVKLVAEFVKGGLLRILNV